MDEFNYYFIFFFLCNEVPCKFKLNKLVQIMCVKNVEIFNSTRGHIKKARTNDQFKFYKIFLQMSIL